MNLQQNTNAHDFIPQCFNCHHPIDPAKPFCSTCGAPVAQQQSQQPMYGVTQAPHGVNQTPISPNKSKPIRDIYVVAGTVLAVAAFWMLTLMMRPSAPPPVANPANVTQAVAPAAVAPSAPARPGPTFFQIDSVLDGRRSNYTDAQRQSEWQSWSGTQITWSGEVVNAEVTSGGRMTVKCNPETWGSDTSVYLDGSQVNQLASIRKGQRITFTGILQEHDDTGYTINDGRITSFN